MIRVKNPVSVVLFVLIAVTTTVPLAGECIGMSASWNKRHAELVFSGLVIRKQAVASGGFKIQVEASRVWKGVVSNPVVVYQLPSIDRVNADEGGAYVIFAHPLKREDRSRFGLPPSTMAFVVPDCVGAMPTRGNEAALRELGRSRPVKSRPATIYVPAVSAMMHPEMMQAIAKSGRHEIAMHGWIHEDPQALNDPEEEWRLISHAGGWASIATEQTHRNAPGTNAGRRMFLFSFP